MHGTDTRTRQHSVSCFRNHRHIDANTVALFHTTCAQGVGELADFVMQFLIGDKLVFVRIIAFPNNRHLISTRRQVTVDTVDAHIQLAVDKPLHIALIQIAFGHLRPRRLPGQKLIRLLCPKGIGVSNRLRIHEVIAFKIDGRSGLEVFGNGI